MKITGADGLSPELIRDEVARGARLVIYTYCVSIVLMTFKQPTSIYFVRAGQSPVMRGLPFTLVTFLFGWWGFPWGPIYSIECLFKNLTGGIDVTDAVLAELSPPFGPDAVHPVPPAPVLHTPPPPKKPFTRRQVLVGVSAVAAVIIGIYASICQSVGKRLQIAVLNGLPTRVTYTLNGEPVSVGPNGYRILTQPEGEFIIEATDAFPAQTFRIETPFWSRPFQRHLAVINPDRLALFYKHYVIYKGERARGDNHGQPTNIVVHANNNHYLLPAPQYAFEEAPETVTMASDAGITSRSRVALIPVTDVAGRIQVVAENLGDEAAKTYATHLALALPDNENAIESAIQVLGPEAALALLESRLDDRPVKIDWHRAYQNLFERLHPGVDLRGRYAAFAAETPEDGGFHYLLGRIEPDPADARRSYERALTATQPCAHAHLGLGFIDMAHGRFSAAFLRYEAAITSGLRNESILNARRETLLALGRYDELLTDLRQRRAENPLNILLAAEEIQLVLAASTDLKAAIRIEDGLLGAAAAEVSKDDLKSMRAYLDGIIAYSSGDETAFAREISTLEGPLYVFQAAISLRDHTTARTALDDFPIIASDYWFMLHLVARQTGDELAADRYWNEAVNALHNEGGTRQRTADQLAGRAPLDMESIRTASLTPLQKSLLFTILGLRHADQQATYHAWAAENNFRRTFPHLLIKSALQPPKQLTRL